MIKLDLSKFITFHLFSLLTVVFLTYIYFIFQTKYINVM